MVVTEYGIEQLDLAIKNQKIVSIERMLNENEQALKEIDAKGLHILPGLIDSHVHFDEPGRAEREGFSTGSACLAASGVTTFFDNPISSDPPVIHSEGFWLKREAAEQNSLLDFGILGGLVRENREELFALMEQGVVAFKGFMSNNTGLKEFSYLDDTSLILGMEKIAEMGAILILHAESEVICSHLAAKNKNLGKNSFLDYEASRPVASEVEAVERAAAFAEATNCKIHIFHASSREVVKAVKRAKARGVDITVETCPHYLSLIVDDFPKLAGATCSPPLRTRAHVESLWEAIKKDEIDTIGSDHSSMPLENGVYGGLSGGQSTLSVLLEEGYFARGISLDTIARLTSIQPAKRFNLYPQKGAIVIGSDADLALIDLNQETILKKDDLFNRHQHSPYIGKRMRGGVTHTISRGEIIYVRGEMTGKSGRGEMVIKNSGLLKDLPNGIPIK